jgi:uncharacterized coiled-coil DUF342 family protein
MTTALRHFGYSLLIACLLLPLGWSQSRPDPLNPVEIDQLRDAAQEPTQRIKLYLQFARARLDALQQIRTDPKVTDRPRQMHDKLQNFLEVYDELNDNIDTFADRGADLRKPLKTVIEADTEFQAKLRAIKSSSDASPAEAQKYQFLLDSAVQAVDDGGKDHRELLTEQDETWKHKKK